MSNTLYITVTKFVSLSTGDEDYGYTAADSYASTYSDGWKTLEDFYADYPTEEALKEAVLADELFFDFDEDVSNIIILFPADGGMSEATMRSLCEAGGVRLVCSEEEEVFGKWDWLDGNGNACDQSFATETDAMRDAIKTLGLK